MQQLKQLQSQVMERETISKNDKSRGNFYLIICFTAVLLSFTSCFSSLKTTSLTNASEKSCRESIKDALWSISMKQGGILPFENDDNVVGIASLPANQVRYIFFNNVTYMYAITKQKEKAYLTLISKKGNGEYEENSIKGIMSAELKNCKCN
jgi:hypothetical protein